MQTGRSPNGCHTEERALIPAVITLLLLVPPVAVAAFWRAAVLRWRGGAPGQLPDTAALVFARVAAVLCTLLPLFQLVLGMLHAGPTGSGAFLQYLAAGLGTLLALGAVAGLLAHAHRWERIASSLAVLVSTSLLLLLTFLGAKHA